MIIIRDLFLAGFAGVMIGFLHSENPSVAIGVFAGFSLFMLFGIYGRIKN